MRIDKQATPVNVVRMKRHLRLYNALPTMGLLGKMYVYLPSKTLVLNRSAVTLDYINNKDAIVVALAEYVVAKNGLWHLVRKN